MTDSTTPNPNPTADNGTAKKPWPDPVESQPDKGAEHDGSGEMKPDKGVRPEPG